MSCSTPGREVPGGHLPPPLPHPESLGQEMQMLLLARQVPVPITVAATLKTPGTPNRATRFFCHVEGGREPPPSRKTANMMMHLCL